MRTALFILLFSSQAFAADHFLYHFKSYDRLGDVLHAYEIGPLWGPKGMVQKAIDMNPGVLKPNGQLYKADVWVKLPIPTKEGWTIPEHVDGLVRKSGKTVVERMVENQNAKTKKVSKKRKRAKENHVKVDYSKLRILRSIISDQELFDEASRGSR